MTVQELIKRLEALPSEYQVLVEGYENGWDTLLELQIANLTRQQPCEDWDGEFERVTPEVCLACRQTRASQSLIGPAISDRYILALLGVVLPIVALVHSAHK